MNATLAFALAAGLAAATYSIFLRLGSSGMHPALGATIVTGIAFLVSGSTTLGLKLAGHPISFSLTSLWFLVIVGIAAAGVDFFSMLAYGGGMKVTSAFVIGGTSTAVVLLVGFLVLHEPFTWTKLAAIVLIAGGIFLLQREGI